MILSLIGHNMLIDLTAIGLFIKKNIKIKQFCLVIEQFNLQYLGNCYLNNNKRFWICICYFCIYLCRSMYNIKHNEITIILLYVHQDFDSLMVSPQNFVLTVFHSSHIHNRWIGSNRKQVIFNYCIL